MRFSELEREYNQGNRQAQLFYNKPPVDLNAKGSRFNLFPYQHPNQRQGGGTYQGYAPLYFKDEKPDYGRSFSNLQQMEQDTYDYFGMDNKPGTNTSRGGLERFGDMLNVGLYAVMNPLYNITDGDDSTSAIGGFRDAFKGANPFRKERDKTLTRTTGDVLDNIGWEKEGGVDLKDPETWSYNDMARALVSFAGDVFLDPTTYLSAGLTSIGGDLAKGSGTVVGDKVVSKMTEEMAEQALVDAGANVSAEAIKSVMRNADKARGIRNVKDVTFGLQNAPFFGNKVPGQAKTVMSKEAIEKFADNGLAPAVNEVLYKMQTSGLAKKFRPDKANMLQKGIENSSYIADLMAHGVANTQTRTQFAKMIQQSGDEIRKIADGMPDNEQKKVLNLLLQDPANSQKRIRPEVMDDLMSEISSITSDGRMLDGKQINFLKEADSFFDVKAPVEPSFGPNQNMKLADIKSKVDEIVSKRPEFKELEGQQYSLFGRLDQEAISGAKTPLTSIPYDGAKQFKSFARGEGTIDDIMNNVNVRMNENKIFNNFTDDLSLYDFRRKGAKEEVVNKLNEQLFGTDVLSKETTGKQLREILGMTDKLDDKGISEILKKDGSFTTKVGANQSRKEALARISENPGLSLDAYSNLQDYFKASKTSFDTSKFADREKLVKYLNDDVFGDNFLSSTITKGVLDDTVDMLDRGEVDKLVGKMKRNGELYDGTNEIHTILGKELGYNNYSNDVFAKIKQLLGKQKEGKISGPEKQKLSELMAISDERTEFLSFFRGLDTDGRQKVLKEMKNDKFVFDRQGIQEALELTQNVESKFFDNFDPLQDKMSKFAEIFDSEKLGVPLNASELEFKNKNIDEYMKFTGQSQKATGDDVLNLLEQLKSGEKPISGAKDKQVMMDLNDPKNFLDEMKYDYSTPLDTIPKPLRPKQPKGKFGELDGKQMQMSGLSSKSGIENSLPGVNDDPFIKLMSDKKYKQDAKVDRFIGDLKGYKDITVDTMEEVKKNIKNIDNPTQFGQAFKELETLDKRAEMVDTIARSIYEGTDKEAKLVQKRFEDVINNGTSDEIGAVIDKFNESFELTQTTREAIKGKSRAKDRGRFVNMLTKDGLKASYDNPDIMLDVSKKFDIRKATDVLGDDFTLKDTEITVDAINSYVKDKYGINKFMNDDMKTLFIKESFDRNKMLYTSEVTDRMVESFGGIVDTSDKNLMFDLKRGNKKAFVDANDFGELFWNMSKDEKESIMRQVGLKDVVRNGYAYNLVEVDSKFINEAEQFFQTALSKGDHPSQSKTLIKYMDSEAFQMAREFGAVQHKKDTNTVLGLYDKFLNLYKTSMTTVNPGFHARNHMSNTFQNYLNVGTEALKPSNQKEAFNILKGGKDIVKIGKEEFTYDDILVMMQGENLLGTGFFAGEMGTGVENILKGSNLNPLDAKNFKGYRMGGAVGQNVEQGDKVLNFVANLRAGKDVMESAENTRKFLFSYSDLSDFERNVMRRIFPFYTFTSKNIPLQLQQVGDNPNVYKNIIKLENVIRDMTPKEEQVNRDYLADYAQNYVQLPGTITNPDGREEAILLDPSLPYQSLGRVGELFDPKRSGRTLASRVSPALRVPYELKNNRNIYFESDIEQYEGHTEDAPVFTDLGQFFGKEPRQINPKDKYLYDQIPPLQSMDRFFKKKGADKAMHALNKIGGVKMMSYDYDKYGYYALRKKLEELTKANQ